jgi:hypothetical protein
MAIKAFKSIYHTLTTKIGSVEYKTPQEYATMQDTGGGSRGLDVTSHSSYDVQGADVAVIAGSTRTIVKATGHGITRVGDFIRFTSGLNDRVEAPVMAIPDANTLVLGTMLPTAPAALDTFRHMRRLSPTVDQDGLVAVSVSAAPAQFVLDGVPTQVVEDTTTPANNTPLPVKITSATGPINITAGDLNVQTSHSGVNYDSMRVGDGTNLMAVNASLEAQVRDDDAIAELLLIKAELSRVDILDQLDTGVITPSVTTIPKSSSNAISIVASLSANVTKIQTIEDVGEFMALYSDAARTSLICYLPLAGGIVDVKIPAATNIFLGAVNDTDITTNTRLMIQFMG